MPKKNNKEIEKYIDKEISKLIKKGKSMSKKDFIKLVFITGVNTGITKEKKEFFELLKKIDIKHYEKEFNKIIPEDLKKAGIVGIFEVMGYCDNCKKKKVLFLDRKTKKAFCCECKPSNSRDYTEIEYGNMWDLSRKMLYSLKEVIRKLKEIKGDKP